MCSRRRHAGIGGLVMAVALACAAPALGAGERTPAERSAAADTPLGSVTALAWSLRTPVGARMVLRPHARFHLKQQTLRALRARKPRLTGSLKARIVTVPVRGKQRTLVTVSRRVRSLPLRLAAGGSITGRRLRVRKWVLSRKQTARVKRVATRQRLAISIHARYRVRYTDARGRTVVTPRRSRTITLPVGLERQRARGKDLRKLASTFRKLLTSAGELKTACVTRNTILEQLRSTYNTMVSGDRTGAAALLMAWMRDAEALRAAGLLSDEQSAMLRSASGRMLRRVGHGQSKRVERAKRWPALRECAPPAARSAQARAHSAGARAHSSQTLVTIIARRVVKRIRKTIRRNAERIFLYDAYFGDPKVDFCTGIFNCASYAKFNPPGLALKGLLESEWPADTSQPSVMELVPEGEFQLEDALIDKQARINSYLNYQETFLTTNPGEVAKKWSELRDSFVRDRWLFQLPSAYYPVSDQLERLPALTAYVNMYLAVLHEGIVNGPRWGLSPDTTLSIEDQIQAELNPNNPGSAMSYSQTIYDAGLALEGTSTDPQTRFNKTNAYLRDMQLAVLDFRDMWRLQDPMAYPYGEPGFKQDRMIYSDAIGTTTQAFSPPPNPFYPLSALTAWTTRITYSYHFDQNWLTAIQADTNSPGARTGAATTGTQSPTYNIAPGATPGPVVQVGTTWDQKNAITDKQKLIGTVRFYFSNGEHADPGGNFYAGPSYDNYTADCCTTYWAFDGEVLAAAKIMGSYNMGDGKYVADSLVLGFRHADSFYYSWKGSLPGKIGAPNTQGCLAVEQVTISSGAHVGARTGSRANGAPLEMHDCSQAWEQNWQYIDYDDPDVSGDDTAQHELAVYAGTMCAAPKDGATAAGTPVGAYYCDGTSPQKWTRNANGSISHDQSTLCLERADGAVANGTPIRLNACTGGDSQRWIWP